MVLSNFRLKRRHVCIFMLFMVFITKFIMNPYILPEKYFYDATTLADRSIYNYSFFTEPFAWLYHFINVLDLKTRYEWEIPLALIGNTMMFIMYFHIKRKNFNLMEFYILISITCFANVYIFQISKDFWQMLVFFCIGIIAKNSTIRFKHCFISLILLMEGLFFRKYYLLTALLYLLLYILMSLTRKLQIKKRLAITVTAIIALLFLFEFVIPDAYLSVSSVRMGLTRGKELSVDSVTLIKNLLPDDFSITSFLLNYFVNFFRICLPIELLNKGLYYFPFFFFQVSLVYLSYKKMKLELIKGKYYKKVSSDYYILLLFFSYMCVSVVFEPDFGSVVRHEIALFPLIYLLLNHKL